MDLFVLNETAETATLDRLRALRDAAATRAEREIVELTIELLSPRHVVPPTRPKSRDDTPADRRPIRTTDDLDDEVVAW